jgi:hypothetical protein
MILLFCALALIGPTVTPREGLFTDDERAKIRAYWNEPGRYSVSDPPEAAATGPWQVRLTVEGSMWLFKYQSAIGAGKNPAPGAPAIPPADRPACEAWIDARVAFDRWSAQREADSKNAELVGSGYKNLAGPAPHEPDDTPSILEKSVGPPPRFASAVRPLQYTTAFSDEASDMYRSKDHVAVRPRFAYYRQENGVAAYGTLLAKLPGEEVKALFLQAGMDDAERRVMMAVSRLEGGFDTINTYDTGYVSVGFLQFIAHRDGKHELGLLLRRMKRDDPEAFADDFHRFGVEVSGVDALVVVDPKSGAEMEGPEAVQKLIEDKRLVAVFQRAGRTSSAFRLAQIRLAKELYWPGDDVVSIRVNGAMLIGKVSEFIRSEAGLATLFDRKVSRGGLGPLAALAAKIAASHKLSSLAELAAYEREIIRAMKDRQDYFRDGSLSQPG